MSLKDSIGKLTGVKVLKEPKALYRINVRALTPLSQEDKPTNHLLNIFRRDSDLKKTPETGEVKLWSFGRFGAFYSVYEFKSDSEDRIVGVSSKLNSGAKIILALFFLIVGFSFVLVVLNFNILRNQLSFLIFGYIWLVLFILYKIYQLESEIELIRICEKLDFVFEMKKENNFSIKNIIIRLFCYPFCFFLLYIVLHIAIPQNQYGLSFGIIGLVSTYLFADIRNFKRNRKK